MSKLLSKLQGRNPDKEARIKAEAEAFARKQGHDPAGLPDESITELDWQGLDPLDRTLDRQVAGLPAMQMGSLPNPRSLAAKMRPSINDQRKINQALESMEPALRAEAQKDTSALLKKLNMTEQANKAALQAKAEARAASGSKYGGVAQSAENINYGRTNKGASDMQDWTTRGSPDIKPSATKRKRPGE